MHRPLFGCTIVVTRVWVVVATTHIIFKTIAV